MTISPSDPSSRRLTAVGWLLILHALADVLVGVYRCMDFEPSLIDVLSAALTRSQLGLLAIWFAIGKEPWSWRLCGLIAGSCFLFSVMSGLALPGQWDLPPSAYWFVEEWAHYFRPAGPGDALIKAPIVIPGVAIPLLLLRAVQGLRTHWGKPWSPAALRNPAWFRFRFQDLAVWSVTASFVLVAIFQTAPYEGWFDDLFYHARHIFRFDKAPAEYSVISSVLYVAVALLALWAALGPGRLRWRLPITLGLSAISAIGFELWANRLAEMTRRWNLSALWFQGTAETAITVITWGLIAGSLGLFWLYDQTSRSQNGFKSRSTRSTGW
jgi:hypothetical protein